MLRPVCTHRTEMCQAVLPGRGRAGCMAKRGNFSSLKTENIQTFPVNKSFNYKYSKEKLLFCFKNLLGPWYSRVSEMWTLRVLCPQRHCPLVCTLGGRSAGTGHLALRVCCFLPGRLVMLAV